MRARLADQTRPIQARVCALAALRVGAILLVLFVQYQQTHVTVIASQSPLLQVSAGLVVFAFVFVAYVSSISHAPFPEVRAVEAVIVIVAYFVVLFATFYLAISLRDPNAFNHPLTRLGGIYFAVSVLSTFGNLEPRTDLAQTVVGLQLLLNFALLGVAIRLVVNAAKKEGIEAPDPASRWRNLYAWLIALLASAILLLGIVFAGAATGSVTAILGVAAIYFAISAALIVADRRALARQRLSAPSAWWSLMPPVYLFIRADRLKQSCVAACIACILTVGAVSNAVTYVSQSGFEARTDTIELEAHHYLQADKGIVADVTCPPIFGFFPNLHVECTAVANGQDYTIVAAFGDHPAPPEFSVESAS